MARWRSDRDKEIAELARRRGIAVEEDEDGNVCFKERGGKFVSRDRSDDWGSYVDSDGWVQHYDGWGDD